LEAESFKDAAFIGRAEKEDERGDGEFGLGEGELEKCASGLAEDAQRSARTEMRAHALHPIRPIVAGRISSTDRGSKFKNSR